MLASDIDRIAAAGLLPANRQTRLPHNASPCSSTIVYLMREGNPKVLRDWGDLVQEGAETLVGDRLAPGPRGDRTDHDLRDPKLGKGDGTGRSVVVMSMGRIEQMGQPFEIKAPPKTTCVRDFIGV